jgi:hypothetical protein
VSGKLFNLKVFIRKYKQWSYWLLAMWICHSYWTSWRLPFSPWSVTWVTWLDVVVVPRLYCLSSVLYPSIDGRRNSGWNCGQLLLFVSINRW